MGFGKAVVNVGTKGLKRHTAFAVPFGTGDFSAIQTTRGHDLDALGTETHRVLHSALHGAAEHNALLELLGDGLSNELGAQIRTADFFDVDVNRHAHHLLNFSLQDLDISTLLADHNARTGRVDRDAGVVSRTLDEDTANRGVLQLLFQEAANLQIFTQRAGEVAANRIPARRPVARHRKTEAVGINFLTHNSPLLSFRVTDRHEDVSGLLADTATAALGARLETTQRRSLLDVNLGDIQLIDVGTKIVLGVGNGRFQSLLDDDCSFLLGEVQDVQSLIHGLPADEVCNQTATLGRQAHTANNSSSFHHFPLLLICSGSVTMEGTSHSKFAQLMTNHVLIDVHRNVLTAVVNGDRQTNHFRNDGRTTGPSLERALIAALLGLGNLFHQGSVYKRSLFQRTRHLRPLISDNDAGQSCCPCACCYECDSHG